MKAKQQLRKPENWPDFEDLCKKLWGEIWKCPEIKKNGRKGQAQNGIDVYGIPINEKNYFGIQCKGKDEYTNSALTKKEVDKEIELAMKFEPPLKKMYFATTANKDAVIESYIRQKNIEHINKDIFEVHLYCWEDIVDLIEENKETYDFYVRNQNYKTEHEIKFVFEDESDKMEIEVPFRRKVTHYVKRPYNPRENRDLTTNILSDMMSYEKLSYSSSIFNHSYARFRFKLLNLGTEALKDFKIFLSFNGDFETIDPCCDELIFTTKEHEYTTINELERKGEINPVKRILVQDDVILFDTIRIKPYKIAADIIIHWKIVSLNYQAEGDLSLKITPAIKFVENTVFVDSTVAVSTIEVIEDFIID